MLKVDKKQKEILKILILVGLTILLTSIKWLR